MENKRSLKYLIVSACLALLVASIGGVVVGAVEAPATSDIQILGATLDLNDKVSIGYVVDAAAVGYDVATNTVQHYVYTYETNPTGTAAKGTPLTDFVYKTYSDGSAYVIFLTKGIAVSDYSDNVFARVVEGDKVGAVKKAGVYELANLMQKQGVSSAANKLVSAVIKYHDAAYKVLTGTASPYKFVTVSDGYIVDGDFKYTSGVYAAGTKLTLADSIDAAKKGATLAGWTDGKNTAYSSVVSVSDSVNYAPTYELLTSAEYNPYTSNWYINGTSSKDSNFQPTATKSVGMGERYWNAIVSGVNGMGEANALPFYHLIQAASTSKGYNALTKYVFRDETGNPVLKFSYEKNPLLNATATAVSETPAMGNNSSFIFANNAVAGEYLDLSYDIMFPTIDKDGDGVVNEAEFQAGVADEDDDGNPITTDPQYGDYFTTSSNAMAVRTYIALTNSANNAGNLADNLLYISYKAVYDANKIVTGFQIQINSGYTHNTANGTTNNASGSTGQADQQSELLPTVYPLDKYIHVTARIIANDDGAVSAVEIYANGVLVETRTAAAGWSKDGLSEKTWDGTIKLFDGEGTTKYKYAGFALTSPGRFRGDYYVKNFECTTGSEISASAVKALADVVTPADTVYPVVHSAWANNAPSGVATGVSTLGDPILGVNLLRSYNTSASWVYDSKLDTITVAHTGSGSAGAFNLHVTNPLKGMAADQREGAAVAFDFNFTVPLIDFDKDGVINEAHEYGGTTSTVLGFMYFGYGNGANGNATPPDGMASAIRLQKNKANVETFHMSDYGRNSTNNLTPNVDGSAVSILGGTAGGILVNIKVVMYPNAESGVIEKVETYVNGTLKNTRTQDSTDIKTQMAYSNDASHSYRSSANIFNAEFLNFSYQLNSSRYASISLSNIQAYVVK